MSQTKTPAWKDWRFPASIKHIPDTAQQPRLPKLPVPPIRDTLDKLVDSTRAVARDTAEWQQLRDQVKEFQSSGMAEKLQNRLVERSEKERSWIAEWWDNDAYMAYRDSVVINVSYYYGWSRLPQADKGPAHVAAHIASKALDFRQSILDGSIAPDKIGANELCMESYKWAFNACRVPAKSADYAVKTAENEAQAQHFVVIKDNAFYSVPFVDQNGQRLSTAALEKALQSVIDEPASKDALPVGVMTGINRDTWSDAYQHLMTNDKNRKTIEAIQSSAFVIALDTNEAGTDSTKDIIDFSYQLWRSSRGNEGNRWWDKPLQFVVFKNGHAGFIGEHSCMDGTPTARMNDVISQDLIAGKVSTTGTSNSAPRITPLAFEFDDSSRSAISTALKEFDSHVSRYRIYYTSYKRYGKNGIKRCGVSPDAWVQMVMQLAHHLTHGTSCATYEAAQVRKYQLGRTETVRVCTNESVAFVRSMTDDSKGPEERETLFRAAVKRHGTDMKDASNAHGIDRHLYGLKKVLSDDPERPALFDNELFARSSTWRMSTSQIYIAKSPSYGWGPVVAGGYGFPYMIHPDSLQFTVTCDQDTPGDEMIKNVEKAADMLMDLMSRSHQEKQGKL